MSACTCGMPDFLKRLMITGDKCGQTLDISFEEDYCSVYKSVMLA